MNKINLQTKILAEQIKLEGIEIKLKEKHRMRYGNFDFDHLEIYRYECSEKNGE